MKSEKNVELAKVRSDKSNQGLEEKETKVDSAERAYDLI
jgi:hypothetical protein